MNSNELEDRLNRIGATIDAAWIIADEVYLGCPEEMLRDAATLRDDLKACFRSLDKLHDRVALGAEAKVSEVEQAALKDAIALLEANGFIVGTKT